MADLENPDIVDESTPLIAIDREPPPLKDIKEQTFKETLVGAAALIGLTTSVASMAIVSNPVVYVSGAIGTIVAPVAAIQQTKLTEVAAMKETNHRLNSEVDSLKAEHERLAAQVSSLETSVGHLQDMSQTLDTIRAVEGQSMEELERQLKESEQILDQMQDNLRGDIVQTLISLVLAIDHDGDMCLSDAEIDSLILKIEEMSSGQFDFKDALLRKKLIEHGRSLNAIMEIIKNLMDENTAPDESIFAFLNKSTQGGDVTELLLEAQG